MGITIMKALINISLYLVVAGTILSSVVAIAETELPPKSIHEQLVDAECYEHHEHKTGNYVTVLPTDDCLAIAYPGGDE